jgi:hypothetical protein
LLETLGTYVPQDGLMLSVGNQTASTETWVWQSIESLHFVMELQLQWIPWIMRFERF